MLWIVVVWLGLVVVGQVVEVLVVLLVVLMRQLLEVFVRSLVEKGWACVRAGAAVLIRGVCRCELSQS